MASNDRIGALYYEVVLDPRGFARGASQVKKEQDLLERAVRSTATRTDEISAEMAQVEKIRANATGKELEVLNDYYEKLQQELRDIATEEQRKHLKFLEYIKKEQAADEKRRKQAAAAAERERLGREKEHQRKLAEIEKERQAYLKSRRERVKQEKSEESFFQQTIRRFNVLEKRYNSGTKGFTKMAKSSTNVFRTLGGQITSVNGGLSKMVGNLAQAAGMPPQIQGLVRAFGLLGAKVLAVTVALYGLAKALAYSIRLGDEAVTQERKLTMIMQGRSKLARALIDDMEQLALKTSFSRDEMIDFATKMKVMGVATKDIKGLAIDLGALAGGDRERFKGISKAYTDVMGKGRLMGQEAIQFAERGVPIYKAIAAATGKSEKNIRKMGEQGKISIEMFQAGIAYQAKFVGGVDALKAGANTVAGQWQQAKDNITAAFRYIGRDLQPVFVAGMKVVNFLARGVAGLIKSAYLFTKAVITPIKAAKDFALWVGSFFSEDLTKKLEEIEEKQEELEADRIAAEEKRNEQERAYNQLLEEQTDKLLDQEHIRERTYKRMLKEKLIAGEITGEQALSLSKKYAEIELELKRQKAAEEQAKKDKKNREDAAKAWIDNLDKQLEGLRRLEEARDSAHKKEAERLKEQQDFWGNIRKEAEKKIEAEKKERLAQADAADSASGASFEAGSAAEFAFLRDQELQNRRDEFAKQVEEEADKKRQALITINSKMLSLMQDQSDRNKDAIDSIDNINDFPN